MTPNATLLRLLLLLLLLLPHLQAMSLRRSPFLPASRHATAGSMNRCGACSLRKSLRPPARLLLYRYLCVHDLEVDNVEWCCSKGPKATVSSVLKNRRLQMRPPFQAQLHPSVAAACLLRPARLAVLPFAEARSRRQRSRQLCPQMMKSRSYAAGQTEHHQ